MTTSSLPASRPVWQAFDQDSAAIPAFQVTKGNNFSAKTALGRILDDESRTTLNPCIHKPFTVFSRFEQAATLTGFETESGGFSMTDKRYVKL